MIADLKPYPEYKESGLPWLGQVPGHWQVRRLKSAVINVIEQTLEMSSEEVYVALEHVESWTGKTRPQSDSSLFTGQVKRFRQGDVLFGKLRPYLAKVTRVGSDGVCAGEFFVLRPTDKAVNSAYLELHLRAKSTIDVINGSTFGAKMPRADWQFCGTLAFPLPPPAEQAAIVRFLDWANGRLERAIRAKRRVIALLNEQKQAIIHRAVTRGLDPSVPLKPSGVRWLGDIPQHWGIIRSKRLFSPRKTLALPDDVQLSATQAYGVIPQSEFEAKVGRRVVKISMHLEKRRHVEQDDFVISMRSFQGGLERAWAPGAIRSSYVVLGKRQGVDTDTDFFSFLFKSRGYIRALQATGDFIRDGQDLNFTNFCRVDLPLIPGDEQRAIAKAITDSTRGLASAISRLNREIELLREYRTRLVADVVTGKLDVRQAAASLPIESADEIVAHESLEEIDAEEEEVSE